MQEPPVAACWGSSLVRHLQRCWGRSHGSHRSCSDGHCRQIAPHFKAEIVAFETEFLDIAVGEHLQQPMELIVIKLHGHPFSRPR